MDFWLPQLVSFLESYQSNWISLKEWKKPINSGSRYTTMSQGQKLKLLAIEDQLEFRYNESSSQKGIISVRSTSNWMKIGKKVRQKTTLHVWMSYTFWDRSTSSPWGPTNISFKKLTNPNQTTGVTSTPPRGGITFLVRLRNGSVGAYATTYGNFFTGSLGYQDMTILRMNKNPRAERKGPVIVMASFAVAGSISATIKPCM